jgi:hypothetical protein
MEFILALPLLLIPVSLPFMAGYMARRFGRNFWVWFFISIPLPLISCFIIACLPDRSTLPVAVESQDIFMELNGIR